MIDTMTLGLVMPMTTRSETMTDTMTLGLVMPMTTRSVTMIDTMTLGLVMPMTTRSEMRKETVGERLRNTKRQSTKPIHPPERYWPKKLNAKYKQKRLLQTRQFFLCASCPT